MPSIELKNISVFNMRHSVTVNSCICNESYYAFDIDAKRPLWLLAMKRGRIV